MTLAERLQALRARIDGACARRGPGPEVRLLGVAKFHPPEAIVEAVAAGLEDVGENYAQELHEKLARLPDLRVRWHFVGNLQRNKLKLVLGRALVHSMDRVELLQAMEQRAATIGLVQDVLVQVNLAEERQKAGVSPDLLGTLLDHFASCSHVRCVGLMSLPPTGLPPAAARAGFRALRELRDRMATQTRPGVLLRELSMGMSDDFELAIEEGATIVRIGTALFGPRPQP
jgi:hypothetical protein